MINSLLSLFGAAKCPMPNFFGLPPWYKYLDYGWIKETKSCGIKNFDLLGKNSDIPLILLAVVDILLRVGGLVAVAFVIYGGIKYIISQGEPDQMGNAKKTIIDALFGLAVAVVGVALVNFIGRALV